jgi:hypothetical protein
MRPSALHVKTIIWFWINIFPFAVACETFVQNPSELNLPVDNFPTRNDLHFCLCTGFQKAIAPKVCVDFCEPSVKVAFVDGRKGWHNKTSRSERLGDQPGGATCQATGPEKTDGSARGSWGLGLRKQ